MPGPYIHVGDIVAFRQTFTDQDGTAVDVSGATTKTLKLKAPDGTVNSYTWSFDSVDGNGLGTDGKVVYTTVITDLNAAGDWQRQWVAVGPTYDNHTDKVEFEVKSNLS